MDQQWSREDYAYALTTCERETRVALAGAKKLQKRVADLEKVGQHLYSTLRAYWRGGRGAGTGYASDEATMHVLKEWEDAH